MGLRIRQIVFAAADLERTAQQFTTELSLPEIFRDPEVATFGLCNVLFEVGQQFLEVVAPTRTDAPAARHLARHGDSAYMLILQTDDLAADRQRLQQLGVRLVWEANHPDISAVHLHPKDVGAAIVSLDQPVPPESWRWAGPQWRPGETHSRIVAAAISAADPAAMAKRWADVLGTAQPQQRDHAWHIAITDGMLSFVESTDSMERIVGYTLEAPKPEPPRELMLCGTHFNIVAPR